MQKRFVTYELAKQLKELGFNENCFRYYNTNLDKKLFINNGDIKAPLYQQVFDWIRDVHDIHVTIDFSSYGKYFYRAYDTSTFEEICLPEPEFDSYQDAVEDIIKLIINIIKHRIYI